MSEAEKPARSWRQITDEVLLESDPARVTELLAELKLAVDEQVLRKPPKPTPF